MVDPLFNAFATAAFFEFVIFAIFEMRYLLMIWRARRASTVEPWVQQRELSLLYGRFYGFLLGGIFIMYNLNRYPLFLHPLLPSFLALFPVALLRIWESDGKVLAALVEIKQWRPTLAVLTMQVNRLDQSAAAFMHSQSLSGR